MKRRGHPEADIQRQIVNGLRAILPAGAVLHHSANEVTAGGEAARRTQSILRGMGVWPGFSDLLLISEGRVLFLEVKSQTGRQSDDQRAFQAAVEAQGFVYELVRSLDDALRALAKHGFKTLIKGWSL
ncbi:VRR-NUC domain-containing protein [Roseovarius sp. D0-M9]|uniref:VRR-NUC domain-containing protein n=1 Tax=Roseovarius sp. D0-M9 TaxID=3127117 RepID=UPI00300FE8EE